MNNKALLTLLALLGWIGICSYWYCNTDCQIAAAESETASIAPNTAVDPIKFASGSNVALNGDNWTSYRDSILSLIAQGKMLQITGYYDQSETNNTSFENLGLARADAIKQLFLQSNPNINPSRFLLRAEEKIGLGAGGSAFVAHNFMLQDTIATPAAEGAVVMQDEKHIIVYFPTGSSVKESNKVVDEGLLKVAEKLKTSGQAANVVGHTDNKGQAAKNIQLSRERADFVKSILVKDGVEATKISTDGKGDKEPVGDNNTDAGRRQNRRVEISIQ